MAATSSDLAEYAKALERLRAVADRIIEAGAAGSLTGEQIAGPLYTSARLFSARRDRTGESRWELGEDELSATETVVLVTALLEAADVNLFDMAIWYRRAE